MELFSSTTCAQSIANALVQHSQKVQQQALTGWSHTVGIEILPAVRVLLIVYRSWQRTRHGIAELPSVDWVVPGMLAPLPGPTSTRGVILLIRL